MSKARFTEEFKEEAVKQVVDRGYAVPDVAKRLGVSAQTLYKWLKAYAPNDKEFGVSVKTNRIFVTRMWVIAYVL